MADGTLLDRLLDGIENIATLDIKTVVTRDDGAHTIATSIDLVQGDITTTIDDLFFDDRYVSLREFHAGREEQGHTIVKDNIEALGKLIAFLREEQLDTRPTPPAPPA